MKQQKKVTGIVRNHLQTAISKRPIAEITSPELLTVLQALKARVMQSSQGSFAAAIFRRAIVRGLRHDDPTVAVRGALATPESQEHPHLEKPEDFGALLKNIDAYKASNFSIEFILKLSPLLFLRPTELGEARWK